MSTTAATTTLKVLLPYVKVIGSSEPLDIPLTILSQNGGRPMCYSFEPEDATEGDDEFDVLTLFNYRRVATRARGEKPLRQYRFLPVENEEDFGRVLEGVRTAMSEEYAGSRWSVEVEVTGGISEETGKSQHFKAILNSWDETEADRSVKDSGWSFKRMRDHLPSIGGVADDGGASSNFRGSMDRRWLQEQMVWSWEMVESAVGDDGTPMQGAEPASSDPRSGDGRRGPDSLIGASSRKRRPRRGSGV